jgi:hypothetical protein
VQQKKKDGVPKKKEDGVQRKRKDGVQKKRMVCNKRRRMVLVEKCTNTKGVNMEPQEYNAIMSFTQLLTAPPCGEDDLF